MLSHQSLTIDPQPNLFFGLHAIDRLSEAVRMTGHARALIVTDHGLTATGIPDTLRDSLQQAGIESTLYDGIVANPGVVVLDEGMTIARSFGPCAIVALGGGSSIDVAKGLGMAAVNPGSGRDFDYRNPQQHPGLPLIAIPTTAGTGAETNAFGVIDDPEAGEKFYVGHASMMPRYVIADPLLTVGLPARPTAATGMDALAHAIEAISAKNTNPMADALGFQAIEMIYAWLPKVVTDGTDIEGRAQMLLAAHIAGRAFATGTGLGLAHGIAHPLSARAGSVHGEVLAVLLPQVMRFNLRARTEVYNRLAQRIGVADPMATAAANAERAIAAIDALPSKLGLETRLSALGATADMIPSIGEKALEDEVTLNAPLPPTLEDVTTILKAVI
ncbi:iron-containing alcohol dehydrogenase family protein [Ferrimicrobium sp.]|uniref:iron-containing alcohol dehydrogenase family protein n=1 Tax=Ferrimicrobium sp. TaxID=2926050 RepID=UPI002630D813|nr:iron-containing alcohol dehydrogenase [Ferrimicrobium sp.]MCL5973873.1 iron-containing alcohol dehydrogenase [Actinomycetota bacterium]